MTDLSPNAKAVSDAFWKGVKYSDDIDDSNIAAVLLTVIERLGYRIIYDNSDGEYVIDVAALRAIATELEAYE